MKKLLAMLALAGFTSAFAQSSVQLFGNIDQGLYRGSYDNKTMLTTGSNVGSTSFWGITGSDNLGGGTKATFDLRSEITLNTGTTGSSTTGTSGTDTRSATVFNRAAWIGLSNNTYGAVQVGRQPDAWWEMTTKFNNTGINSFGWATATAVVSGATSQHLLYGGTDLSASGKALNYMGASSNNPSYTGSSEAFLGGISYTTPKLAGFTGKVQVGSVDPSYSTSQQANNAFSSNVVYESGPLTLAVGYDSKNDANSNAAYKQTALGAKYALSNGYTLTAARNKTEFGGLAKTQGGHDMIINAVGVGKTINLWDLNVGYTTLKDDQANDNHARLLGATARYNFSKQTSVYFGAGQAKNYGQSRLGPVYAASAATIPVAGDVGKTVNAVMTGIRYTF